MHRRPLPLSVLSVALLVATAVPAAASNAASSIARGPRAVTTVSSRSAVYARDISFPQCGRRLPAPHTAAFGVLGANNGRALTRNPCLVEQLRWAKTLPGPPAFYANTGNPGPDRTSHWPVGQTWPATCRASDRNSLACSYDYGWNAAWQSYTVAVDAAQRLHHVSRQNARYRAANVDWWLDVETMNSWQSTEAHPSTRGQARNVAAIAGELDALHSIGVANVGIYSTAYQWRVITGGGRNARAQLGGSPQWLAGYASRSAASAGCRDRGFTGGPVRLTQFLGSDGFDANVICR